MRFGITGLMGAFIGGVAAMYFIDAQSGGRRRALVRDRTMRAQHRALDTLEHVERDFENRARGVVARVASIVERGPVDDETLIERVRAKLGHVCSHPSAIEVHAKGNGTIELKGSVLAREKFHVLAAITLVPGVKMIDDDLDVHATLPGEPRRGSVIQRHWNPTTRFLTGATGALFVLRGLLEEGLAAPINLGVGSALISAAALVEFPSARRQRALGHARRQEPQLTAS